MASSIIDFRCGGGREFWQNTHDALDLLSGAESYHFLRGAPRRQTKCELTTFLALAAFRYKRPQPGYAVQEALERTERLNAHNPHILRIHLVRRPRTIVFDSDLNPQPPQEGLPVGRLDGYTSVMPVTLDVFKYLDETDGMPPQGCWEHYSIAGSREATPHPYLYIRGVVHLPSLAFKREIVADSTYPILIGMIRHLGHFLEPFDYERKRDRFVAQPGRVLPKLLCARDDRRMAEALIWGAGFAPCNTRDAVGNEKFRLDFDAYNDRNLRTDECNAMRRAYRLLKHYLEW